MKKLILLIPLLLAGFGYTSARADNHHELIIQAKVLTSATTSGTLTYVTSTKVDNATLIAAEVSGTTTAKDLTIVMDDETAEIDIIKKADNTIVYTLGQGVGGTSTDAELHSHDKHKPKGYEVITGYQITLPGKSAVLADLYLTLGDVYTGPTEEFEKTSASFFGGYDGSNPDAFILEGSASTASKVYVY